MNAIVYGKENDGSTLFLRLNRLRLPAAARSPDWCGAALFWMFYQLAAAIRMAPCSMLPQTELRERIQVSHTNLYHTRT